MKANKKKDPVNTRRIAAAAASVVFVAALVALGFAYTKLKRLWLEQCVITDIATQVSITDGKMVRSDVVAMGFGLKNGANLALIDFDSKREEMLKKIPNIRNITVSRHLPNRVTIDVEERVPVVRLNIKGRKGSSGRVADTDGVVFISSNGTQMLPTIREGSAPGTQKGQKLEGVALSALRLIETCRTGYSDLAIVEADVSKDDYITVVLAKDYSQAKIAWDGMKDPSDAMLPSLKSRLDRLSSAISSDVDKSIRVWNATMPGKVTGDTKRGFL